MIPVLRSSGGSCERDSAFRSGSSCIILTITLLALSCPAQSQTADALLDKLIEKGIGRLRLGGTGERQQGNREDDARGTRTERAISLAASARTPEDRNHAANNQHEIADRSRARL